MKLADDALIKIIEILRQGLMEGKDVSELLRELDLESVNGKLSVQAQGAATDWVQDTD